MVIVLTGGAGFIGSCLLSRLNHDGYTDIIVVDHFDDDNDPKHANLKGKSYTAYYDKGDFLKMVESGDFSEKPAIVLHMGACSSTTGQDAEYYRTNNLEYSKAMALWALSHGARFIYASSAATYGEGTEGYSDEIEAIRACRPLNLYGESKHKFDEWVLEEKLLDKVVGLKFFNVFGPNEYHKADMRSVVAKAYDGVVTDGVMALFKSYRPDYGDGEQKRDFIYVKDVVDVVFFFMDHPGRNGIFNVGTGQARSWNELARALFRAVGKEPNIRYVDMPEVLKPRYQYFTEADMSRLRACGYVKPFTSLEDAVADYAGYLMNQSYL